MTFLSFPLLFLLTSYAETSNYCASIPNTAVKRSLFNRVNCSYYLFNGALIAFQRTLSAMSPAKTAEPIEMQFAMLSRVGPGNM